MRVGPCLPKYPLASCPSVRFPSSSSTTGGTQLAVGMECVGPCLPSGNLPTRSLPLSLPPVCFVGNLPQAPSGKVPANSQLASKAWELAYPFAFHRVLYIDVAIHTDISSRIFLLVSEACCQSIFIMVLMIVESDGR